MITPIVSSGKQRTAIAEFLNDVGAPLTKVFLVILVNKVCSESPIG